MNINIKNGYGKIEFGGNSIPFHLVKLSEIYTFLDKFISFLTISSLFISTNAALLVFYSFLIYNINVDFSLMLAAFFLTFAVYNLDKLLDVKEDSINLPERARFFSINKKSVTYVTIISYFAALSFSFLQNLLAFFVILTPLCIGLIYSIKISNFRLKDILAVKNIAVASSWALMGTFLPLAVLYGYISKIMLIFYFFFIKLFVNTVIFDVRDIKGDRISGVRTIPVVFGREKTKNLLLGLNSTLIIWLALSYFMGFFRQYLLVFIFCIFYGYLYILYFCKDGLKAGNSFDLFVDGEWVIIAILATAVTLF